MFECMSRHVGFSTFRTNPNPDQSNIYPFFNQSKSGVAATVWKKKEDDKKDSFFNTTEYWVHTRFYSDEKWYSFLNSKL